MISRRRFVSTSAIVAGAAAVNRVAIDTLHSQAPSILRLRPGGHDSGYDPWLEIDADAFRHNAREVSRLAGGRPILAVVKNNGYGLGDTLVGPLLASCAEVRGIACVRASEALALRNAGVKKPILIMSEVSEEEAVDLVARDVTLSCWLDDSGQRLERIAKRSHKRVAVHLFLDTGLNREGMPYQRALPWIEDLARRPAVRIDGTYHVFVHQVEFDRVQHARFLQLTEAARNRGVALGTLHAAPSYEVFYLPEAHLDMVRVANALWGNYPGNDVRDRATLKPVFRLRARVARVEQLQQGESAGFRRAFAPDRPTWLALLPIGHTDGYPITAAGTCQALINGRLYPVVAGGVASAHTIVDVGIDRQVNVGDTATLIGGDVAAIDPAAVASNTGLPLQQLITKFNALLPRRLT
jgi:alanine racemase